MKAQIFLEARWPLVRTIQWNERRSPSPQPSPPGEGESCQAMSIDGRSLPLEMMVDEGTLRWSPQGGAASHGIAAIERKEHKGKSICFFAFCAFFCGH